MVKKKPPFILLTIVVIAVGWVVVSNMKSHGSDLASAPTPDQTNKPRPAESLDTVNTAMKAAIPPSANLHPKKPPATAETKATLLVAPKPKDEKPKPNDAMVGDGWYSPKAGH